MRLALQFAYDGKPFHGYARQPQVKTVEGDIVSLLIKHGFIEDTAESMFRSASRTDKGVSALCNVVAFNTIASASNLLRTLSKESSDIIFYGIAQVDTSFYPRHAQTRSYRYYLKKHSIDPDVLLSSSSLFTGEHNLSNFARVEPFKEPVRTIGNVVITETDSFFVFDFYAQTFLWHQIRRILAATEKAARGELAKEHLVEALHNPEKTVDFGLAPPEPLILTNIVYDVIFDYDTDMRKQVNELEQRIVSRL